MMRPIAITAMLLAYPAYAQQAAKPPMTISQSDQFIMQVTKCWTIPATKSDKPPVVRLHVQLRRDGTVAAVFTTDVQRYTSDADYKLLTDSAIRALQQCQPYRSLPANRYDTWRIMELNFDPAIMLK